MTEVLLEHQMGMLDPRPFPQRNQMPTAGSQWSDGLSHNAGLARHQVVRLSGSQYKQSQAHLPRRPDSQMGFSAWLLPTHPGGGFQIFLKVMTSLFPWWGIRVGVSLGIREGGPPPSMLLSPVPVGQQEGSIMQCEVKTLPLGRCIGERKARMWC